MINTLRFPISRPFSLNDLSNWHQRVLKEKMKQQGSRPYSLGDLIDWRRSYLRDQSKRRLASKVSALR